MLGLIPAAHYLTRDPLARRWGEHYGIDVSAHQGKIDWCQVRGSGVEFAYLKATEGGDWIDEHFAENWRGAAAAGLRRGAYHFFTLKRPGADQADNFLRTVPSDPQALPAAVDLEFTGNSPHRPRRCDFLRQLGTFIERVEAATGRPVVIYLMEDFEYQYRIREAFPRRLWRRSLLRRPKLDNWQIWQINDCEIIPGITGPVDVNYMKY